MADPTRYLPGFNYSGWEADHPTEPKPGAELDNDFAHIRHSIDETIRALRDVRRSDGKLGNALVTFDTLNPAVKAAIAGSEFDYEVIEDLLAKDANLQDLPNKAEALENLGALARAGNLAELEDAGEARANLGALGAAADASGFNTPSGLGSLWTLGRHTPGDGGGALLIEGESTDPGAIQDANGKWWKVADAAINVRQFGARGDGSTDDTDALQAAINFATLAGKRLYWPAGGYVASERLDGFWEVQHEGEGRILRGDDVWHITPTGDQVNTIYSGSGGSSVRDGFSPDERVPPVTAFQRLSSIGAKAGAGIWRVRLLGNISANGVRITNMPVFANRLEVWGEDVNTEASEEPTTVWDGTSATAVMAFRAQYANASLFMHFKNIKFTNWNRNSSATAILIWCPGDILVDNCHAIDCSNGYRFRQNHATVQYGRIKGSTQGVGGAYSGTLNVGGLNGEGVTIEDCVIGVSVGRTSICYTQGCTFKGEFTNIFDVTRWSRLRTQANDFTQANFSNVVYTGLGGLWTPDNFGGNPDNYPALSPESLAFKNDGNSVHMHIQRGASRTVHNITKGEIEVSGTTSRILLSTYASNSTWIPFRLPAFYLYNSDFVLDLEMVMELSDGVGGTLELTGDGANANLALATIDLPAPETTIRGRVFIRVYNSGVSNTARQIVEFPALDVFSERTTANLDQSQIRTNSENLLNFRLYWQPTSTGISRFRNARSYVEA